MLCSRCIRATTSVWRIQRHTTQQRSLSLLSIITSTRPSLSPPRLSPPTSNASVETTTLTPLAGLSISQIRGAKRATYKPSHVVRKRRHGFLSRVKTRTGMQIIKRRRVKKRNTLSH